MMSTDLREHSPAAERNSGPILAELLRRLPRTGVMLEIASGTGQHAAHFSAALPGWRWIASDSDARALLSIRAWCADIKNVSDALPLDVMQPFWAGVPNQVDTIFNANMLHISPWPTCAALMRGAARHMSAQGQLLLYGPFLEEGETTAPSNLDFDADLRARDAAWGIRRLADVEDQAAAVGLKLKERVPMPANNLLLILTRRTSA